MRISGDLSIRVFLAAGDTATALNLFVISGPEPGPPNWYWAAAASSEDAVRLSGELLLSYCYYCDGDGWKQKKDGGRAPPPGFGEPKLKLW